MRLEIRRVIQQNVDFLAKLVLKSTEEPDRDITGKSVVDLGCEKFAILADGPKELYTL